METQRRSGPKNAAVVLAAVFLMIVLASALFEVLHADHDCSGENCPVCVQISVCEKLLTSGTVSAAVVMLAVCSAAALTSVRKIKSSKRRDTLLSLKVMLLN